MVSISTWTLLAVLGAGGETVLLDFTATWCGPCRAMEPVIHRLQAAGYPVRQIDVDRHPQLAAQYGVNAVPCFVMLRDGQVVDRVMGAATYERLAQMASATRSVPTASGVRPEIRGQSPDRFPLGGRLRQMVGGLRGGAAESSQPATPPPPTIESPSLPTARDAYDAGPEPPAALREYGLADAAPQEEHLTAPAYEPPAADIPAMAPRFHDEADELRPASGGPEAFASTTASATLPAGGVSPEERAMAASVRLKVDDGQFFSYATGAIVAVQPNGEALILTCGHVFRDSQGRGAIAVEIFGAQRQGPMPGRLIAYDLERDLGLVSIRPAGTVTPVAIAGPETYIREGLRTFSIGCDRGAEPTTREGRITGVNRYLGAPNLVASGRPVVGRSGGGLFDSEGTLIGVCRFADGEADEGVYVSFPAIAAQWEAWGLGNLPRSAPPAPLAQQLGTTGVSTPPAESAISSDSSPRGDQPADFDYTQAPARVARWEKAPPPAAAHAQTVEAALSEPLFIVRSRGAGGSEVLLLEQPSRAFLDQLQQERTSPVSDAARVQQAVRDALNDVRLSQRSDEPIFRAQSPLQQNAVYHADRRTR